MKKIILIIVSLIGAGVILGVCMHKVVFTYFANREKTTDVSKYSDYFGEEGKNKNDIFPKSIPESAKVDYFTYYYCDIFDPNTVSYLVYSCNDEDYEKEKERLSKIDSSEDYLIYSATGFNYPVSAVYADEYEGYIYALADDENKKLIYVEIRFCNYVSDINYKRIIDKKYLPIDFDAREGNETRQEFDRNHSPWSE